MRALGSKLASNGFGARRRRRRKRRGGCHPLDKSKSKNSPKIASFLPKSFSRLRRVNLDASGFLKSTKFFPVSRNTVFIRASALQ